MPDIPLVRTDGKSFSDGVTLTPDRFVHGGALSRASKSALARQAELAYDLGDSLYFFAGHACPSFGDLVLVYVPSCLDNGEGDATPFDTGRLFTRKIFTPAWDALDPASAEKARAEFVAQSRQALAGWRAALDAYVTELFATPRAYLVGEHPNKNDESGRLLDARNSRRAWTWEVRSHADHPIGEGLRRIWASADYAEAIRQQVLTLDDDKRKSWNERVGMHILAADPGESPHARAEAEMAS